MADRPTSPPDVNAKYDWIPAHNEMVVKLKEESDRAAALLAASFLESEMTRRLKDFLVDDESTAKLFETYRPISTFSALVDVCFAVGLMTRTMRSDLSLVRKARNHFAHHPKHLTFTDAPVSDWCRELSWAKGVPTQNGDVFRIEGPRDAYLFTVGTTLTYFDRFVGAAARCLIPEFPLPR
jgi:hypothetical protein